MTFKSDNKLIIVTVNKSYPSFSSIYLQDVNYNNTLEETDKVFDFFFLLK